MNPSPRVSLTESEEGEEEDKHAECAGWSAGTWSEKILVPLTCIHRVPSSIPLEQVAQIEINPLTALGLLSPEVCQLHPGDWVVQNAANSAVGQCVSMFACSLGIHTLNVVRRAEQAEHMALQFEKRRVRLDGSVGLAVFTSEEELLRDKPPGTLLSNILPSLYPLLTEGGNIRLALNAVGGDSAKALAKCLCTSGTHVTYGAMGLEPIQIANALLIFKDIRFRGFHMSRFLQGIEKSVVEDYRRIVHKIFSETGFEIDVDSVYPLEECNEAITRACSGGRSGKVLLNMEK